MILIIAAALIGLIFGGLPGLLVGGGVAWGILWFFRNQVVGGIKLAQSQVMDSAFSIMGAVSKADGVVSKTEIQAAERLFEMLRLTPEQRKSAIDAFNRGKQADFDLDGAVDNFRNITRGSSAFLQLFLQMQVMAVAADGKVEQAEHDLLVRIARRLGLSEQDVRQLEALLRTVSAGGPAGGAPTADRLDDAYQALGVSKTASDAEVKRAYRKLISENHPDKLAARGLPESMRAVAEERSREINKAYDLVKESRGM